MHNVILAKRLIARRHVLDVQGARADILAGFTARIYQLLTEY